MPQAREKIGVDAGKVLQFVTVSGAFAKRAADALGKHETAQQKAAAMRPELLQLMLSSGVIAENQKSAADAALADHSQTMHLLKTAVTKLAAVKTAGVKTAVTKQAGDRLGQGVDQSPADGEKSADDIYPSPFVGGQTGRKRSDEIFVERLMGPA